MTENRQSNLFTDLAPPVAPGEYLLNKAKIAEAKALISAYEEMNEAGKQSHDELARELEQKIREGEQAREMLSQLRSQSALQVPPVRKPAIDYPSSTSRIEEVPNYGPGSQVQYQQFQGTSNQQTYNSNPQVTVQPVASSSYQQYNPQQLTPVNPNGGQSKQYSQQSTLQISSTSHTPFSLLSDQGSHDNHSHPVAPTQGQRHVPSHQEPLHYGNSGSSQGQWRTAQMYSPSQTIPVHAPGPSSQAADNSRPPHNTQQSSSTNSYPEATVSQSQAMASGATSQGPLLHKTTNIATQSQLATALGLQPNASSSNSVPSLWIPEKLSRNPIDRKGEYNLALDLDLTPGNPLARIPTTLPSINMHHTQFIPELREAIKKWDVNVPPNSFFSHPSQSFKVLKDHKGAIRIFVRIVFDGKLCSRTVEVDTFYELIRYGNKTQQQTISSTTRKAVPSTAAKANVQATSSATPHRPGYPEPGASSSKQTSSTMSSSTHNQGIARQIATPSTPPQTGTSASQIQLSTSISVPQTPRPLPPSTAQIQSSASVPKTPIRQLSTIVNGVPRSAEQADKKSLASHILFGLGKRPRETSPTESTEPQPKRHALQATGQVVAGVSPSASYTIGQATPAVQKPNVPNGVPTASSSLQQPLQHDFIPPTIPRDTQQISQAPSASSGDQHQPVNVTLEVPSISNVAGAVEVSEASKTPLSLQDARTIPPDTSSTVVQLTTQPSPVPLAVPVPVPSESLLESAKIAQPVAPTVLKQPQASTPAKLELSFTGVPALGTGAEMAQKNQPLFLPSPVSSPGMDANDDVSISGTQSANMASLSFDLRKISSSSKRKNHAYVLAPRRPAYLVKYFQLEKPKISHTSLKTKMTSRSSLSKSVAGEEGFYYATENLSPSYAEQHAIQLASSRLQELSCKWDGCSVKMNSVDALIHHLNRQHKPPSTSHSKYFSCRWTLCGRRCNLHEKHLEKHASLPLNCPYEDCEESFRSAPPLLKHTRAEHENDKLKPSTQLSYPTVELPDAILGVIPSYMIMTRGVNPYEISSARHAILAPRVLRDIAGLERERSKNKAKRTVRSNGDIIPDEDSSNDYDFLSARPTRYSSQLSQPVDMRLEDLNSENISRLVDEGLMLWGQVVRTGTPSPVVDREHRSEGEQMLVVA